VGSINPFQTVSIRRNTGYTITPDGMRIAVYVTLSGIAQVQDLSSDDLKLVEGLNIQGARKTVYLNGTWAGVVRAAGKGGDVFTFDGYDWLVTLVAEAWPDWTKVIVTLQSP
jgi:hypothetical protein